MIQAGANVNAVDDRKLTPLMWAILEGHVHIVKLLLNADAKVNVANKNGKSTYTIAKESNNPEIIKLIAKQYFKELLKAGVSKRKQLKELWHEPKFQEWAWRPEGPLGREFIEERRDIQKIIGPYVPPRKKTSFGRHRNIGTNSCTTKKRCTRCNEMRARSSFTKVKPTMNKMNKKKGKSLKTCKGCRNFV